MMRSEDQMMELVLEVARRDERVRAVTLEGSRTNPNVPRDIFQDYDISYHVTEMDSFLKNPGWVDVFGERVIMQTPEDMAMFPPELGNRFSYLMLFTDGNRIDMTLIPIEEKEAYCQEDKLLKVLLDKDGTFPVIPRRQMWIIGSSAPRRPTMPIAAMSFGGYLPMWPKGCGDRKSCTPRSISTTMSGRCS